MYYCPGLKSQRSEFPCFLPREGSRRELITAERGSLFVVALLPGRHACLAGGGAFSSVSLHGFTSQTM